jgi:hypothetical protein
MIVYWKEADCDNLRGYFTKGAGGAHCYPGYYPGNLSKEIKEEKLINQLSKNYYAMATF